VFKLSLHVSDMSRKVLKLISEVSECKPLASGRWVAPSGTGCTKRSRASITASRNAMAAD